MPAKTLRAPNGWIAGAAIVLILAGVAIARRSSSSSPVAVAVAKPASFAAEAWPAGALATYRVAWKSDANVVVDPGAANASRTVAVAAASREEQGLATHLHLEGELTLRSYGARDGALALGFVLSRVNVAKAEALGRPATNELEAELRAAEAVAIVEADGEVREIGFSAVTTPTARGALRALVLEYTAFVGASNGRTVVDTSLGKARIERTPDGGLSRVAYDELDALPEGFDHAATRVTGDGTLAGADGPAATVTSNEEIFAKGEHGLVSKFHATTSLTATLIRTAKETSAPIPSYVPAGVRPSVESAEQGEKDRTASLERRSVGVTAESVWADVQVAASLPQRGLTEWVWHDSAYLRLHPEQTSLLLDRAMAQPALNTRGAAVDVVVVSGTDAAQRALMHSFDTTKMSSVDREQLFQHLQQVVKPSLDFLRWAETEHVKSKGTNQWLATSFTLGGLAWHAEDDHPETATRFVEMLEGELKVAQTDKDREIAIRALGNAGSAHSLPLLVPYAKSTEPRLRAAAAAAARRMEGEASVDMLLTLVADTDGFVATSAVQSLYRKNLAMEDWQALAKSMDDDRVPEEAHASLVNGALLRRADNPECAPLLTACLKSPKVAYKLKERIVSAVKRSPGTETVPAEEVTP